MSNIETDRKDLTTANTRTGTLPEAKPTAAGTSILDNLDTNSNNKGPLSKAGTNESSLTPAGHFVLQRFEALNSVLEEVKPSSSSEQINAALARVSSEFNSNIISPLGALPPGSSPIVELANRHNLLVDLRISADRTADRFSPLTAVEVAPLELRQEDSNNLMRQFSEATGVPLPNLSGVGLYSFVRNLQGGFFRENTAAYGMNIDLTGGGSAIVINEAKIRSDNMNRNVILSNELASLAFSQAYPQISRREAEVDLAQLGLTRFDGTSKFSINQISEMSSDYASLLAGEKISSLVARSLQQDTMQNYALSFAIVQKQITSYAENPQIPEAERQLIKTIFSTPMTPAEMEKALDQLPAFQATLKAKIMSEMRDTLVKITPSLQAFEQQLATGK
jgi:hypothetical protein